MNGTAEKVSIMRNEFERQLPYRFTVEQKKPVSWKIANRLLAESAQKR